MRLLIVLFLLTTGCYYLPAEKVLRQIENLPYKKPNMVCWHKALAYHEYLKASGIKSRVVVGDPYDTMKRGVNHAWVEVEKNGKWYMVDPTNKGLTDGFEVKHYPERTNRRVVRW